MSKFNKIIILACVLSMVLYVFLHYDISLHSLLAYYSKLKPFTGTILFVVVFYCFYCVGVALSLPVVLIMNVLSGMFFGPIFAIIGDCVAYFIGASINYILVKYLLREFVGNKIRYYLDKIKDMIGERVIMNLIGLRVMPIIPFSVINIACALLDISFYQFALSTVLGILPQTIIFAFLGASAQIMLEKNGLGFDITQLITPGKIYVLVIVGIIFLLPFVYDKVLILLKINEVRNKFGKIKSRWNKK